MAGFLTGREQIYYNYNAILYQLNGFSTMVKPLLLLPAGDRLDNADL